MAMMSVTVVSVMPMTVVPVTTMAMVSLSSRRQEADDQKRPCAHNRKGQPFP
jgi:hypothetical protein